MTPTDYNEPNIKVVATKKSKTEKGLSGNYVSEFNVPKMDCPSEERIIRLSLDSIEPLVELRVDIPSRKIVVFHGENLHEITTRLQSLGFGATMVNTREADAAELSEIRASTVEDDKQEYNVLRILLGINGIMFFVEFSFGLVAQSAGLIADSLDMFADASVYGVALFAVGRSVKLKLRAAHLSGWLQMLLALGALSEVLRRFVFGSEPVSTLMIVIGCLALLANIACLLLIHKKKDRGAHMEASFIFSANDVIANTGVIIAGVLVVLTGSRYPDLIIGIIIGLIVLNGARRILRLKS